MYRVARPGEVRLMRRILPGSIVRVVRQEQATYCPITVRPHMHEIHENELGIHYYFCEAKNDYLAECDTCDCYCDCQLGYERCDCGCHD